MAQRPTLDPCRLVRQVKQFGGYRSGELLHLPDKPAGVGSLAKFATLEKKETRMKPGSIHKKISWTPEDRARHQAIRDKFKDWHPGLEELLANGEYLGPFRSGSYQAF